ncbi:MAG: hypothetical protein ACOYOA_09255 [Saprospiraceae bacterium]
MKFPSIYKIIGWSSAIVFAARGMQMFVSDSPIRILLWDENLMKPIVENYLSISWENWTNDFNLENRIALLSKLTGLLFFSCALSSIVLAYKLKINKTVQLFLKALIWIGLFSLILMYFLYAKDKSYRATEFLEYALQWGSPLMLLLYPFLNSIQIDRLTRTLIALVFFSHGLYAIGFYAIPSSYISYTMSGFHLNESAAKNLLLLVGYIDITFSIFIYSKKVTHFSIYYFIIWGFMTTVARLWCNWHPEMWEISVRQYFHEMLVRVPHFLIPFTLWKSMSTAVSE